MMDPRQTGRLMALVILLAALASFAVMFSQRAEPPQFDRSIGR